MRIFCFLILCLLSCVSMAQVSEQKKLVYKKILTSSEASGNTFLSKVVRLAIDEKADSVLYFTANTSEVFKNPAFTSDFHCLRGFALFDKGLFRQAKEEFLKISKDKDYYNFIKFSLGEVEFMLGNYKKSMYKYSLVDTSTKESWRYVSKYDLYASMGRVSFFLKRFEESERYMRLAEQLMSPKEMLRNKALFYTDYASLYYEQYRDSLAMGYFKKAYDIANKSGDIDTKVTCTCNLANVYLNGKHYEKSAKFFKECKELTDEKFDKDKIWEAGQREKQLMLKIKQEEISILANENRIRNLQRNGFIILALFLGVILVMGYYQYKLNQKRAKLIFEQKVALDELNATKDQLFSIIGHDLRSSVNALRSGTVSLENTLESNDMKAAREQLEQNTVIATNTYNLLDNLLQWSLLQTKGGYFKPEEHRLSMIIEQVAYNYKGVLAQHGLSFVNEVPRSTRVWVDAESLKLVLRNFMDNSIKFSKKSGQISTVLIQETPDTVTFSWEDEGMGMSAETRDKLLQAKRLDRKEHEHTIGAGLGMQLVISMINRNGGTLDISSELGKGTKMLVTLRKKGNGEVKDSIG